MAWRRRSSARRALVWSAAWLTFAVAVATAGAAPAATDATSHGQRLVLARHAAATGGTANSLNWSGYVVTPRARKAIAVTAEFVVPAIASPVPPGIASTWVGIGGSSTADLIQAGVQEQTFGNPLTGPQYSAWFELLPATSTPLTGCRGRTRGCSVQAGDRIRISIRRVATTTWSIRMVDVGHWRWAKQVHYSSSGSSAEWITEAPELTVAQTVIAHLADVLFDRANTFTLAGQPPRRIRSGRPTMIVLGVGGAVSEAIPSPLDRDGDGFTVCTYSTTCPTPSS